MVEVIVLRPWPRHARLAVTIANATGQGASELGVIALPLLDAAVAAAAQCRWWIGRGDKEAADHAAVEAMREMLGRVPGTGVVVIGEGEKDEAPMLYAGEEVGDGAGPLFDIAVDPLEGTTLCAGGTPGAITVIAAAPSGTMRALAGFYMHKMVVGAPARGCIDIDAPIEDNLTAVAGASGKAVEDLRVAVLLRPRHSDLIAKIRGVGAAVVEIPDGDVMAGLAALLPGGGLDMSVGIGGTPEGVITAAAVRLLEGDMQSRLAPQDDAEREACRAASELDELFTVNDLVDSEGAVFVASGVTGTSALAGPQPSDEGLAIHSVLITRDQGLLRLRSTVPSP